MASTNVGTNRCRFFQGAILASPGESRLSLPLSSFRRSSAPLFPLSRSPTAPRGSVPIDADFLWKSSRLPLGSLPLGSRDAVLTFPGEWASTSVGTNRCRFSRQPPWHPLASRGPLSLFSLVGIPPDIVPTSLVLPRRRESRYQSLQIFFRT